MSESFNRREFLKVVTLASSGVLAACSSVPPQKLIPYVVPPEGIIPGVSTWYKSVCRECPAGCGTMVRTREGRALKVEGNPDHPVNRGTLCARGQAAIQGLYNPDRIVQPLRRNEEGKLEPVAWLQAEDMVASLIRYLRHIGEPERIAVVSERVTGARESLWRDWLAALGSRHFMMYEPFAYEALRAGNRIAFGTPEIPRHDIAAARMLLCFGADFIETWVSNVEYTGQFAAMRRRLDQTAARFVHVEPRLSLTAANADEWLPVRPNTEVFLALGLLREILNNDLGRVRGPEADQLLRMAASYRTDVVEQRTGIPADRVGSLAREFAAAEPGLALGPGVAASGPYATALQVAVNLLNYVCGNVGQTIHFGQGSNWDGVASRRDMFTLIDAMRTEQLAVIFFHHTNPAGTLPPIAGFRETLARVPMKISFSSVMDETTALCDLILPDHTPLERWEDYSPRAGVYGIVQPVMRPDFHFVTHNAGDFLLAITPKIDAQLAQKFNYPDFLSYLREQWKSLQKQFAPQQDFEDFWRAAVEAGGVWKEAPEQPVKLSPAVFRQDFRAALSSWDQDQQSAKPQDLHLVVYPSLQLFDGRGANRPWLQETPEAMTKIVWDTWAEIHPETAKQRGIAEGDLLRLTAASGSIQVAAHHYEGIRKDTIAIPLGQGHGKAFGRWADGHGPSPIVLLPAITEDGSGGQLWGGTRVNVEKLALNRPLVQTQIETSQHDRDLAAVVPLSALLSGAKIGPEEVSTLSMYPPHAHPVHRWGMVIDLNACVGCNACIVACYAENNVHWVGKEQVGRGRHMAWIRVDRYFQPLPTRAGESETIETLLPRPIETRFLVVPCQQCDNAPCESVCPVYATYHNAEGLNVQVYNRCVGTRYCSNNCPYKVRRFNWFDWTWPWPMQLGLNPDVSARSKGVMEKCTFCIQRIRAGEDRAKDENRRVRDGEITPACAQTCPAQAILFGDLKDPTSRVSMLTKDRRGYHLLAELNTRPAITYLKKVKRSREG